jgi:flagellar motor protein MotB
MRRNTCILHVLVASGSIAAAACGGGAAASGVGRLDDAVRTRRMLAGKDAQNLAPQAFALADQELALANEAKAHGDTIGAELHAERAMAAYNDAIALARLARAAQDDAAASEALARASELAQRYAAQRRAIDREAEDLEKQLRIMREAQLPVASGAADPERERARLVATQSLVTQARLLCSAARLVSAQAPGLADAESAVSALEKQLESGARTPAPIDPAARARAACLASLTKARRASSAEADQTDALLAEITQASIGGKPPAGQARALDVAAARDERGVVVTLRGIWSGAELTAEGQNALKVLGRVAAAHPAFGVQVVVHDAAPPSAADAAADQKRGEAAAKALAEGGAPSAKTKVELAGARAPVVDPQDAKRRERNSRLEVVFVAPSS